MPYRALKHSDFLRGDLVGESMEAALPLDPSTFPWDGPDEARIAKGFECVKRGRTRCVLRFMAIGPSGAPAWVYAKRCRVRMWIRRLGSLLRFSKSHREWDLGWTLLRLGIPTATPLLWAERRRFGMLGESYLLLLGVERPTSSLDVWRTLSTPEMKREWLGRLARFIRQAHEQGFAHDDLSAEHVLVANWDRSATGSAPQFHFIDLDHGRMAGEISDYRRAHNFFQIFRSLPSKTLGPGERRAFLRSYSDGRWTDLELDRIERLIRLVARFKSIRKMLL